MMVGFMTINFFNLLDNFSKHFIAGSPFSIKCQGQGAGTVMEKIEQKRPASNVIFPDQECQLCLRVPGKLKPMLWHYRMLQEAYRA